MDEVTLNPLGAPTPKPARPKKKRAPRKPKSASAPALVKQEAAPAPARIVEQKTEKRRRSKTSVFTVIFQLVFAVAVVVGAYYAWNAFMAFKSDADKRNADLQNQVQEKVGSVQEKFDALVQSLESEKAKQQEAERRQSSTVGDSGLAFTYLAILGDAKQSTVEVGDQKGIAITFASNPDIWIDVLPEKAKSVTDPMLDPATKSYASCDKPLVVSDAGYCDNVTVAGLQAVERVFVEKDKEGHITRLVKATSFTTTGETKRVIRLFADLGTPTLDGRDVFTPTDEKAQGDAVQTFVRALLKRSELPVVLEENLRLFDDILAHIGAK